MDDERWEAGMPVLDRQPVPGGEPAPTTPSGGTLPPSLAALPPRSVPETAPTPLQKHYVLLSAPALVAGAVAITALEMGAGTDGLLVKLCVVVAAPLLLITTADATIRIWRSAWAWMPVESRPGPVPPQLGRGQRGVPDAHRCRDAARAGGLTDGATAERRGARAAGGAWTRLGRPVDRCTVGRWCAGLDRRHGSLLLAVRHRARADRAARGEPRPACVPRVPLRRLREPEAGRDHDARDRRGRGDPHPAWDRARSRPVGAARRVSRGGRDGERGCSPRDARGDRPAGGAGSDHRPLLASRGGRRDADPARPGSWAASRC